MGTKKKTFLNDSPTLWLEHSLCTSLRVCSSTWRDTNILEKLQEGRPRICYYSQVRSKNMKDISNINSSSGGMLNNGTSSNGRSHLENCLVVDLGTATTKSGWSNRSEPDMSIPSIVGHGRHKGAMATLGLSDSYVGRQAQTLQGILNIRQPFKQGCVQHWDDLELLWDHTWKQELKRMRVSFWKKYFEYEST